MLKIRDIVSTKLLVFYGEQSVQMAKYRNHNYSEKTREFFDPFLYRLIILFFTFIIISASGQFGQHWVFR